MLDIAIKYAQELEEKMYGTWFDEKYMFYNYFPYYSRCELASETWGRNEFVSLNKSGDVIGFIGYGIDRVTNCCEGLGIINFSENKITFGKDLGRALKDVFEKFNFNKLKFSVVIGNPAEKQYDKMIKKYGGRVIGIEKQEVRLIDGKLYDVKRYEILKSEYAEAVKKKGDYGKRI